MSTPFWRPWRDETCAEPVNEQLAIEARRAVREFRTQQLPVMAPASGKLTREMVLKAWNHLYEPWPQLPVHPDEYARMRKEAEEPPSRPHFVITRLDK